MDNIFIIGNKSSSSCTVCHATQKQFSIPTKVAPDIERTYELGLSPLHARIRFMEHCLNIAYNIDFEKYKQNNSDFNCMSFKEKQIIKQKFNTTAKQKIQENFRKYTGLIIDMPKQCFGSSNDGNTARRFFENTELTSSITQIDEQLLIRFKIILSAINCREKVDPAKFGKYTSDTVSLYDELYGEWRKMSPTLHKVLCHGENIMKYHIFPLGELSEEAQETKNKQYKEFRLRHTRKCSRKEQNRDLMKMLQVSSDPLISSLRHNVLNRLDNEITSELSNLLL